MNAQTRERNLHNMRYLRRLLVDGVIERNDIFLAYQSREEAERVQKIIAAHRGTSVHLGWLRNASRQAVNETFFDEIRPARVKGVAQELV